MEECYVSFIKRVGRGGDVTPHASLRSTMENDSGFAFRHLLLEISQKLRTEDAHNLAYVYQLQLGRGERRGSETLNALVQLGEKGVFSSSKPDGLLTALESIERQDLVELARERVVKGGRAHLRRSPTDVSSQYAQEVAEYKIALAHVELLRSHTQKLRSYPHQSANAKILTTVIRKVDGIKQWMSLALENLSSLAPDLASPESGTYGELAGRSIDSCTR